MAAVKNPRRGVQIHNAKLNPDKVRWIRQEAASGRSAKSLADELGVTNKTVCNVINYATWFHVH